MPFTYVLLVQTQLQFGEHCVLSTNGISFFNPGFQRISKGVQVSFSWLIFMLIKLNLSCAVFHFDVQCLKAEEHLLYVTDCPHPIAILAKSLKEA